MSFLLNSALFPTGPEMCFLDSVYVRISLLLRPKNCWRRGFWFWFFCLFVCYNCFFVCVFRSPFQIPHLVIW